MSSTQINLSDDLAAYVSGVAYRESDAQRGLREKTAPMSSSIMQISPEQGALMSILVQVMNARLCIEVGTFTGYSALTVASALPADGKIICCDVSDEWTSIGKPFWRQAGVADKIDLRIAPASETLDNLIADGLEGKVDFAFIDADKSGYDTYYEQLLTLLRPNGLIGIDNVLWGGSVIDPSDMSDDTVAIRALNEKIAADDRVEIAMVPIGDGLTLARKK
ncbi:MAG: class I SAM-dependent methyltransferase [Alphaproteobacteria bacterium]